MYGWKPYVPVAERRRKAAKAMTKLAKGGRELAPVIIAGRALASTFWGKAWNQNLEAYSDYDNRLPRGRTYARNGSVLDLQIGPGEIQALVSGSSIYDVKIQVARVPKEAWASIRQDCAGGVESLVELLQGRLSKGVMERLCRQQTGLFPSPKDIHFSCSCPDWASMCKHVAAVLYGVGARLDEQPELLFTLRRVEVQDLLAHVGKDLPLGKAGLGKGKVLVDSNVADLFDLEMADAPPEAQPARKPLPSTRPAKQGKALQGSCKAAAQASAKPPAKTAQIQAKAPARGSAKAPSKVSSKPSTKEAATPRKPASSARKPSPAAKAASKPVPKPVSKSGGGAPNGLSPNPARKRAAPKPKPRGGTLG